MKRTLIKIDEVKCNGCGDCVKGCHEGALQMIDGKAKLVSELYCDGLGACIGECPVGAITLEEREAEAYSEVAVMERIATQGEKVILAHLKHLKDHNENEYINQAIGYMKEKNIKINLSSLLNPSGGGNGHSNNADSHSEGGSGHSGGCPGSKSMDFGRLTPIKLSYDSPVERQSELTHWPIQLHLVNPEASYYKKADVVLASDCSAFSIPDFHEKYLKGKSLAIACPKLDSNKQVYVEKLRTMFESSEINTLTVVIMEVPCCGGLVQLAQLALEQSSRSVPLKLITVGVRGEILQEQWVSLN